MCVRTYCTQYCKGGINDESEIGGAGKLVHKYGKYLRTDLCLLARDTFEIHWMYQVHTYWYSTVLYSTLL